LITSGSGEGRIRSLPTPVAEAIGPLGIRRSRENEYFPRNHQIKGLQRCGPFQFAGCDILLPCGTEQDGVAHWNHS
jgi:hypothetical protein